MKQKKMPGKRAQNKTPSNPKKAWVISVDMGYGHQRAAYPLKDVAYKRLITANNDEIVPQEEKKLWKKARFVYESVSRMKDVPFFGALTFGTYDRMQQISPFFPFRDLSKPNFSVFCQKRRIVKKGLCSRIMEYVSTKPELPVITTHFIPAMACDYSGIKNEVYCLLTDSDINRIWVSDQPKKTKVTYLAPCRHVVKRLREYGVPEKNIILTGYPLPKENIGGVGCRTLKHDLGKRLPNLDPKGVYINHYQNHIKKVLGGKNFSDKSDHPLTITYLVGGAGAQREIGVAIASSLKKRIQKKQVILNLVAGTRKEVSSFFMKKLKKAGLSNQIGKGIRIFFTYDKNSYFLDLNYALRSTDIIWTKPSEMSFYTGLGFPVILTNPVGAHEIYNKEWLEHIGSGFMQEKPEYVDDWLFYWLESGRFAEGALEGFIEAPTLGTYNIEELILGIKHNSVTKDRFFI